MNKFNWRWLLIFQLALVACSTPQNDTARSRTETVVGVWTPAGMFKPLGMNQYVVSDLVGAPDGKLYAVAHWTLPNDPPHPNTTVFSSNDHGVTWAEKNVGLPTIVDMRFLTIDRDGALYLAANSSQNYAHSPLYKSVDGGSTWNPIGVGFPGDARLGRVAQDPQGVLYAAINVFAPPKMNGSIYKSVDGGNTWAIAGTYGYTAGDSGPINDMTVDSSGAIFVSAGYFRGSNSTSTVFRSDDGGSSWSVVYTQSQAGLLNHFALGPNGNCYLGGDTTLAKSADGGHSWVGVQHTWPPAAGLKALVVDGHGVLYGGSTGIYKSDDGGLTWVVFGTDWPVVQGLPLTAETLALDGKTILAGTQTDQLFNLNTAIYGAMFLP